MEKNNFIGECLYFLFRQYKLNPEYYLKFGRKKGFLNDMQISLKLINCLEDDSVREVDLFQLLEISKHSTLLNFIRTKQNINSIGKEAVYKNINFAMKSMAEDVIALIEKRPQQYKNKIAHLLHALHNLPRVYINEPSEFTSLSGISEEEAMKYSKWNLSEIEINKYFG